jgi:hypothetical protein
MTGDKVGGVTCIGVSQEISMPGLGLGLLCAAIEQLKVRGVTSCFVDWVSIYFKITSDDIRYRIKIGTRRLGSKYSGSTRRVGKPFNDCILGEY